MSHAIPTVYEGVEYRSRLEARWAAFFTEIGWKHTYEPFDGNGYIPDFLIYGEHPLLVEVKPAVSLDDYLAPIIKIMHGLRGHWDDSTLIVGANPLTPYLHDSNNGDLYNAGCLGNPAINPEDQELAWYYRLTGWCECGECGATAVVNAKLSRHEPCGHPHKDGDEGGAYWPVHDAWGDACNAVKWRGRGAEQSFNPRRFTPPPPQQDAPIPATAPASIHQHEWDAMPIPAKQAIANVVAGIA